MENKEMNNIEVLDNIDQEQSQEEQPQEQQEQFKWDAELFMQLVKTPEGKKEMERFRDKGVTKGIETWKSNNLEKLVEVEIEKRFPTDPDKKRIQELERELKAKEIHEVAMSTLAQNEIPPTLASFFIGESVESTQEGLEKFIKTFNQAVNKEVTERIKGFGSVPRSAPAIQRMTAEEVLNLPYDQRVLLYHQNPDEYKRIMMG